MIGSFDSLNPVAEYPKEPAAVISFEIENAGLAITGAFLPRLFEMVGFIDNNVFTSEMAREDALRALSYTAFGEELQVHEQALAKLLCGYEQDSFVDIQSPLPMKYREAVDGLLNSLISNLDIGITSIEGLRATYLARAGVLKKEANVWQLEVVPKPFDLLLERSPLAYSVIKLQWMEQAIHVNWR